MDSRTIILNRIKKALNDIDKTNLQEPELPEIWPVTGKSKEELATVFAENLKSVAGQAEICKDWDDAVVKIGETMNEIASSSEKDAPFQLGVYSSELAQKTARKLLENNGDWTDLNVPENPNIDPNDYESMAASLVTPLRFSPIPVPVQSKDTPPLKGSFATFPPSALLLQKRANCVKIYRTPGPKFKKKWKTLSNAARLCWSRGQAALLISKRNSFWEYMVLNDSWCF